MENKQPSKKQRRTDNQYPGYYPRYPNPNERDPYYRWRPIDYRGNQGPPDYPPQYDYPEDEDSEEEVQTPPGQSQPPVPPRRPANYNRYSPQSRQDPHSQNSETKPSRKKSKKVALPPIPEKPEHAEQSAAQPNEESEDDDSSLPQDKSAKGGSNTQVNIPMFLSKTYEIVTNESDDIIEWTDDGTGFVVKNQNEFQDKVLEKYFKHRNFSSFIRQLNMYDFHKSRDVSNFQCFKHSHFLKGRPDLLKKIKRKNAEKKYTYPAQPPPPYKHPGYHPGYPPQRPPFDYEDYPMPGRRRDQKRFRKEGFYDRDYGFPDQEGYYPPPPGKFGEFGRGRPHHDQNYPDYPADRNPGSFRPYPQHSPEKSGEFPSNRTFGPGFGRGSGMLEENEGRQASNKQLDQQRLPPSRMFDNPEQKSNRRKLEAIEDELGGFNQDKSFGRFPGSHLPRLPMSSEPGPEGPIFQMLQQKFTPVIQQLQQQNEQLDRQVQSHQQKLQDCIHHIKDLQKQNQQMQHVFLSLFAPPQQGAISNKSFTGERSNGQSLLLNIFANLLQKDPRELIARFESMAPKHDEPFDPSDRLQSRGVEIQDLSSNPSTKNDPSHIARDDSLNLFQKGSKNSKSLDFEIGKLILGGQNSKQFNLASFFGGARNQPHQLPWKEDFKAPQLQLQQELEEGSQMSKVNPLDMDIMHNQTPLSPNTSKLVQQNFDNLEKIISQSDRIDADQIPAPSKMSARAPLIPRSPSGLNGFAHNMDQSFNNEFSSVTDILNNHDPQQPLRLQPSQSIVKNVSTLAEPPSEAEAARIVGDADHEHPAPDLTPMNLQDQIFEGKSSMQMSQIDERSNDARPSSFAGSNTQRQSQSTSQKQSQALMLATNAVPLQEAPVVTNTAMEPRDVESRDGSMASKLRTGSKSSRQAIPT